MIKFSIVTDSSGLLSKRACIDQYGQLEIDSSGCRMSSGQAQQWGLPSGLSQLPDVLNSLTQAQALTLGVTGNASVQIVTKQALPRHPGAISRTKEYFNWPSEDALVVVDYDPSEYGSKVRDAAHLIEILSEADPQFKNVEYVATDSTSSNLYLDGQCVKGKGGMHLYFRVQVNPESIEPYFENLAKKLWLKGYGYILISKSGSMLERTVIDTSVYDSSRLIFEGGIKIESDRIIQNRQGAEYVPQHQAALSVTGLVLMPHEDAEYRNRVNEAKSKLEPIQKKIKQGYRRERETELKGKGIDEISINKMLDAAEGFELLPGMTLVFDEWHDAEGNVISPATVDVAWALQNPEICDGVTLADPLEPDYGGGTNKAIMRYFKGELTIYSHAHGGQLYRLLHDYQSLRAHLDNLPHDQCVSQWARLTANAKLSASEKDQIAEYLKNKIRITKKSFEIDLRESREVCAAQDPQTQHAVADLFINEYLRQQYREGIISVQGNVYILMGGIWTKVDHTAFSVIIGQEFNIISVCTRVSDYVAISKHVVKILDQGSNFFDEDYLPVGIATPVGFYRIDDNAQILVEPIEPFKHRATFMVHAAPAYVETPFLTHWLNTSITGEDADAQKFLLQEIFGAVLFGLMSRYRKVLLLYGATSTGKSMLMRLLQLLFPRELQSTIKPSDWSNEQHRVCLANSRLNVAGDIPASRVIEGDMFKAITGGDEFSGKSVYKEVQEHIRSNAAHVFSSNALPAVQGDDAFFDRWLVVHFKQSIKEEQRITNLELKIMENETSGLLYWAMEGAQRVVMNKGFSVTPSHKSIIEDWKVKANSVRNFLADTDDIEITGRQQDFIKRSDLYKRYQRWCPENGRTAMAKYRALEVFNSSLQSGSDDGGNRGYRGVRFKSLF